MVRDLLSNFPGKTTKFELKYVQETSRTASGQVLVQDMATPYWVASWNFYQSLHPYDFAPWRARFHRMRGSLETFYAYAPSKKPLVYVRGGVAIPDVSNLTVSDISGLRDTVTIANLSRDFKFSIGDYIQIGEANLYSVDAVIDYNQVAVSPPINASIAKGEKVKVEDTYCIMRISKDGLDMQIDDSGRGTISFEAEQVV